MSPLCLPLLSCACEQLSGHQTQSLLFCGMYMACLLCIPALYSVPTRLFASFGYMSGCRHRRYVKIYIYLHVHPCVQSTSPDLLLT